GGSAPAAAGAATPPGYLGSKEEGQARPAAPGVKRMVDGGGGGCIQSLYTSCGGRRSVQTTSNLTKRATYELRQRILQGGLPGGTRLYEVALSEDLEISRTPVREAMSRL